MYDWKRREETKNLLRHDTTNERSKNDKTKLQSSANGSSLTPSKSRTNYPQHHLNVSSNIFNNGASSRNGEMSAEKNLKPRTNRTFDHSPIFGMERNKTEHQEDSSAKKDQKAMAAVRSSNTFNSQVFRKESINENQQEAQNTNRENGISETFRERNMNNKSQFTLSHKENNDSESFKVFNTKKRVMQNDSNIFKPLTPRSAKVNQYKIRDHTTAEIFGEVPQEYVKKPQPIPYEPLYSQREESPAQRKMMQFYASRDENGEFLQKIERCHTSHDQRELSGNLSSRNNQKYGINGSTSEASIRHLTPQMKKQYHMLGSLSEYKEQDIIKKSQAEMDKYKNEIRSYNDKWYNKVEKAKNNVECFLSNKQIAEQQKFKQLKSDFFDEVNNQIFGGTKDINDPNSITAEEIGVRPIVPQPQPIQAKKQQKWQMDTAHDDQRRKDQQYSDLFGYGNHTTKVNPRSLKGDQALFPANFQSNKYDSIKFKTDFPSANIEYGKRPEQEVQEKLSEEVGNGISNQSDKDNEDKSLKTKMNQNCDSRFYANLSSCLDQSGYRNNFSKNNNWKEPKNLKFDKYKLNEKIVDEQQNASFNFGCPKNDEGKNQRIIEIDFKNFSDKFDESEFKRYCSRKGIHLVDFQYDFNKLNNKIAGSGQVKIRDIHQDTNGIENVKDHLRQQGLVIKNSRITLSTQSGNYHGGSHVPHKTSFTQVDSPSSEFNPNITSQSLQQQKGKINKKNIESKGFKLLVTKKKKQTDDVQPSSNKLGNAQSAQKLYDTARSEIDTAKKVVENHNWKKAIDGVSKESKRNQEIRAKSALVNRKAVTIVE